MLSAVESCGIRTILSKMTLEELISLADTMTLKMITVDTTEDAVKAILSYSTSAVDILKRRKVKKEYIFQYLHDASVPVIPSTDKAAHMKKALEFWGSQVDSTSVIIESDLLLQTELKTFRKFNDNFLILTKGGKLLVWNHTADRGLDDCSSPPRKKMLKDIPKDHSTDSDQIMRVAKICVIDTVYINKESIVHSIIKMINDNNECIKSQQLRFEITDRDMFVNNYCQINGVKTKWAALYRRLRQSAVIKRIDGPKSYEFSDKHIRIV